MRRKAYTVCWLSVVLLAANWLSAQEIIEETYGFEEPAAALSAGPRPAPYALPLIKAKNAQTIAGASMFFAGMALDWGVLEPWSFRYSAHLAARDTVTEADATEVLQILAAGIPIGMLEISGASVACAGASRVYGIYREAVSPEVKDVKVWIPYIIGWAGRGGGTVLGFIAGLTNNTGMMMSASICTLVGQAGWTTSTIMSLAYANRWRGQARMKVSMRPLYSPEKGSGLAVVGEF